MQWAVTPSHWWKDFLLNPGCADQLDLSQFSSWSLKVSEGFLFIIVVCLCLQKKVDAGSLTAESKRYMERLIKLGKRNGLHLPRETQEVTSIFYSCRETSLGAFLSVRSPTCLTFTPPLTPVIPHAARLLIEHLGLYSWYWSIEKLRELIVFLITESDFQCICNCTLQYEGVFLNSLCRFRSQSLTFSLL